MRQVAARSDPDQPARLVTLPVSWDDRAADALASLVPGVAGVSLAAASSVWLSVIAARARQAGQSESLAIALHALLRQRQAAPNAAIWACEPGTDMAAPPGFILNVAAFHTAGGFYDVAGFAAAASDAARACRLLAPAAPACQIGLAGLDDLLACLGLAYDSRAARDLGACLAALLRAQVELAQEGDQPDLLAEPASWPAPPRACPIPGLAEAAAAARAKIRSVPGAVPATGIFPPGPVEALLGIETGGIAPAFSPVRLCDAQARHLTRAAQDRLAAAALSPEAALAAVLAGDTPLPVAGREAHAAMHAAIAPYLDAMPPSPASLPAPPATHATAGRDASPRHRPLPARHAGLTQKVLLGGHRVFLRTGEYADGTLGEITLVLPRENATVRGLAEGFAHSVSLGLQHGVPLGEFVDAFAHTRFGFAGSVEGDADIDRASSLLDYVFRTLSATYLSRHLPAPEMEDESRAPAAHSPLLPLDLPASTRRRGLRLVA